MKEQLISFETAKLAKEKGFTHAYEFYTIHGKLEEFGMVGGWDNCHSLNYAAPTQALLQKWLREMHKIEFIQRFTHDSLKGETLYVCDPIHVPTGRSIRIKRMNTYEDALEVGLQEALTLIKT